MRDRIFYVICFGFLVGVLLRSFVLVNFYFAMLLALLAAGLFLFFLFIAKNQWPARPSDWSGAGGGIIISVFIIAFSLGIFRFNLVDVSNPDVFETRVGQRASLSGEIVDEPSIKENNQQLVVETREEKVQVKILIYADLAGDYKYGDEINFSGILKKPVNFITDQGKEFDYINYLRKDGILYVMSYPKIEVISQGDGNLIKSALFYVKEKFLEKINRAIVAPENLLLGGLILGEKSAFSQDLRKSFVDTGTIHIVALSGYNVTIVAEWFMKFFAFLPKNFGIGMGIFAILLFIVMTGASSTAIRAGVMASLALFARATGRNYDVARALLLAGVLMVIFNPFVLAHDVSFQLSFIATVAVIFFTPKIEKYFLWVSKSFGLRDIISVTTAAYIFVFPFILYKMGNFSLVALPANILVLPFIPFTMLLGFLTSLAGILWYPLAVPIGYISYLFLHYELGIIDFFSKIPLASLSFPNFPLFLTLIIYAYFIYKLFGRNIKEFFTAPQQNFPQ